MPGDAKGPKKVEANVWSCEDFRAAIMEKLEVHVEDVELRKKLENALADFVMYKATSRYVEWEE